MPEEEKTEIKRNPDGTFPVGNPGGPGRPKGSFSLKTLLINKIQEVPFGQTKTYAHQLMEALIDKAIVNGDVAAIKLILSYSDGLPVQPIGNADGTPLQVQFAQLFNISTDGAVKLDPTFNATTPQQTGADNTQPG